MSIHVAVTHSTIYAYDRAVGLSPQVVRLRPAPHCRTPILAYSLRVEPRDHFINWQQDPYGNFLARLVFPEPAERLELTVDVVADLTTINPFDFFVDPSAEHVPFTYDDETLRDLTPYLEVTESGDELARLAAKLGARRHEVPNTVDFLVEANRAVERRVRYLIRLEPGVQTPEETLRLESGSCRDSAWLLVQLFRRLGLAARFVSGYLIQLRADIASLDGPAGPAADFTDLHAWTEVYVPGAGWIGLDPTSGLLTGEGHLPLAATPSPRSAAPVTGFSDPCEVEFSHEMRVTRVAETPRVTLPYAENTWRDIETLGARIDEILDAADVRLSTGGEPTFVSIDDMEGEEWNTAALGPAKERLADVLLRRLRDRWAPGAVLLHGQGKWYPGESLPRWAYRGVSRTDGEPVWTRDELLAKAGADLGHDVETARRFATELATRLGSGTGSALLAYEDAFYHLWQERRLPPDIDPFDANLDDPEERQRLVRIFRRGLKEPAGVVIPLRARSIPSGVEFESGTWFLRDERLYLLPGDSPIGFRLPLDSLPDVDRIETALHPLDPLAPRRPLPKFQSMRAQPCGASVAGSAKIEPSTVRTALCLESRHGRLHIFLPPFETAEAFLALIGTLEETAATLSIPVVLEGYPPPWDPRLREFKVTPDPGVIEVNVPPTRTWPELVEQTASLYEEARLSRLGTEKFLIDGRHCGTGGGNHVVLGGPTPADSPFLRRPDLLRSLAAYWLNHPSLSYLFSGLFIGPTSQAPRIDEGRRDAIHELEIAFSRVPRDGACPPWLVDRLFRHLFVDGTGNTHRAEISIDKLYSPDSASGRLGLVEFRAFEMPPHSRMSLAQQLLLRALVATFWREPYERPLVRWGTEIHDRFLLPHFVLRDFDDVLGDLGRAGLSLRTEFFAPHAEFRFPRIGTVTRRGVEIELRTAIEPWYVLGEEAAAGGTARYVDSSVERLQVLVRGMTEPRHVVTCNGRRLPLHPTGTNGEFVAGVRYRAWQPPSCLHPTIPVHTPLVFDLWDDWSERSLGGATYHVAHPGGRNHETLPVNPLEAESRRVARFEPRGHTAGHVGPPPEESRNPDYPLTLDLRRE